MDLLHLPEIAIGIVILLLLILAIVRAKTRERGEESMDFKKGRFK